MQPIEYWYFLRLRPLYLLCSPVADKQMVDYLSALLSICFMIFLGFTDDVLDLPWRWVSFAPNQ